MRAVLLGACLIVAGCGPTPAGADPAETAEAAAAEPPQPAPQDEGGSPVPPALAPLSTYVDKNPYEEVGGVAFLDNETVRQALQASGAPAEAIALIRDRNTVSGPVLHIRGRYIASGYDPASGGDVNWTILVSADGQKAAVCHAVGAPDVRDSGAAETIHWYHDGQMVFSSPERCPYDAESLAPWGNWPVGPLPGAG